jgi:hypothetical protein
MNCKPGDLAVVVKACGPNIGKIVRCIAFLPAHKVLTSRGKEILACWSIDPPLPSHMAGVLADVAPDDWLRPIRDPGDDAIDESRAWVPPVPTLEHA